MTDKTRWLGLGPWHEDNESELIDWTAQPQYKGLVKGDYYHAELRYSGRWGDPGHMGGCWPTASNMWRTRSWKSRTWTLTMTY